MTKVKDPQMRHQVKLLQLNEHCYCLTLVGVLFEGTKCCQSCSLYVIANMIKGPKIINVRYHQCSGNNKSIDLKDTLKYLHYQHLLGVNGTVLVVETLYYSTTATPHK